jgi:hypothetical protein
LKVAKEEIVGLVAAVDWFLAQDDAAMEAEFRRHADAWSYFQSRPPWYRRTAAHLVTSAKREETRRRRLRALIDASAAGRDIPELARPKRSSPRPAKKTP